MVTLHVCNKLLHSLDGTPGVSRFMIYLCRMLEGYFQFDCIKHCWFSLSTPVAILDRLIKDDFLHCSYEYIEMSSPKACNDNQSMFF